MPSAKKEMNSVLLLQWWGKGVTLNKWSVKPSLTFRIWAQTEGTKDRDTKKPGVQGIQRVQQCNWRKLNVDFSGY